MKSHYSSFFTSVLSLLCISLLFIPQVSEAQVPPSIYNRYQTLATSFTQIIEEKEKQPTEESKQKLIENIKLFYQQQSTHSLERQLLASNLYLQVLLMQQNYSQSYQVVESLLSQSLSQQQQLTFHQLAGQLAAQFKDASDASSTQWSLVEKHFTAWFSILKKLDKKQRSNYKISEKQEASNAALLAQAFYLQHKLNEALFPAKQAYNLFPKEEPYLKLLLALLQGLEKYKELNQYLQIAVIDFPQSEDYWHRLAYSYLSLDNNELALSTLAITRNQGLLNTQGYKILASLYLQLQQPRLAADVYLEGAKNKRLEKDESYYEILTNAWLMARDRKQALNLLASAKKAGFQSNKQEQQQAQLLYLEGRWEEAEVAYKSLLRNHIEDKTQSTTKQQDKNKLTIDKWHFLLAMSQIEQNKKTQAKASLLTLQTKQYQGYAKEWIAQLEEK